MSVAEDGQNQIVTAPSRGVHAGGLSLRLPAVSSSDGCSPPGLIFIWLRSEPSALGPGDDARGPGPPGVSSALSVATSQETPLENQLLWSGAG